MNKGIFIRLLWREWRENWMYLVVGCGLPLVCAFVEPRIDKELRGTLPILCMGICSLLFFMQAGIRDFNSKSGNAVKKQLFPIPSFFEYLFAYIISALLPLLMGVSLGVMEWKTSGNWMYVDIPLIGWISFFVAISLTAHLLIVLNGRLANILVGIMFGAAYILSTAFGDNVGGKNLPVVFLPWFVTGIVVSIIVWEYCRKRLWLNLGRIIVIIILASAVLLPSKEFWAKQSEEIAILQNQFATKDQSNYDNYRNEVYSYNLRVHVASELGANGPKLICDNVQNNTIITHKFSNEVIPMAVNNDGSRVLLLQRKKWGIYAQLLRWEPQSNRVMKIADIPMANRGGYLAGVDNSGDRVFFLVESFIGTYSGDLWVVDVQSGRAKMIVGYSKDFNSEMNMLVNWEEKQASYFSRKKKYVVAFPSLATSIYELPAVRNMK